MAKEIKIKAIGKYNGHNIKVNKAIDLGLKFSYDELESYIKLIQLLNENISITTKNLDEKPIKLGTFMLKEIKVDHDGEGIIKFTSQLDYVDADGINQLVGTEQFKVMFEAMIEGEE